MDKIYEFIATNSGVFTWILVALFILAAVGIALAVIFIRKYILKRAYVKTLLKSIDTLDKKVGALEEEVKTLASEREALANENATLKSEKTIVVQKGIEQDKAIEDYLSQINLLKIKLAGLQGEFDKTLTELQEIKESMIPQEEYQKAIDELEAAKNKTTKVDKLITKVEELTKKAKPVIKKVVKKEAAKLKKYSLEDLTNMYKHELMTLASDLKLTGWTRFSKEKLVNFIFENLPKEQKKKEEK